MALFGVTLPDTARLRLDAGAPELRLEELALDRGARAGPSGAPARPQRRGGGLRDRRSRKRRGAHLRPQRGARLRRWRSSGGGWTAAWRLRRAVGLPADRGDEAFRLVNDEGDGLPGLTADVYGAYLVISVPGKGLLPLGRLLARGGAGRVGRERGLPLERGGGEGAGQRSPGPLGQGGVRRREPPAKLVVRELGRALRGAPAGAR